MRHKYSSYLTHENNQKDLSHGDNTQSNLDSFNSYKHTHPHSTQLRQANKNTLLLCFIFTFIFALVEALGGYLTNSIALQSDALHMLTDALGLLIAVLANSISKRPATVNLTFGYGKAEAIGALMNCIFTSILTLGLLLEVIIRLFKPILVHGVGLFIIAGIGFLVNGALAFILSRNQNSLNIKAAFLHAMGDLLASLVAIIAGVIIYWTNLWIVDPILSIIVIIILMVSNYKLIKKSIVVLMAGVPEHLSYEAIGKDLEAIEGVIDVHDLHIWYMSASKAALCAHVVCKHPYLWHQTLINCQKMLLYKYKIDHITLQHEFEQSHLDKNYCEIQ